MTPEDKLVKKIEGKVFKYETTREDKRRRYELSTKELRQVHKSHIIDRWINNTVAYITWAIFQSYLYIKETIHGRDKTRRP